MYIFIGTFKKITVQTVLLNQIFNLNIASFLHVVNYSFKIIFNNYIELHCVDEP